jgi:hypothetical protein
MANAHTLAVGLTKKGDRSGSMMLGHTDHNTVGIQLIIEGDGPVEAVAKILVSNNGKSWFPAMSVTAKGDCEATHGKTELLPWQYIVAEVSEIKGDNARVSVLMSQ